jgi:hypothetical protein
MTIICSLNAFSVKATNLQIFCILELLITNLLMCLINITLSPESIWGIESVFIQFLTSALGGGEWSALSPGHFTPREIAPRKSPLARRLGGTQIRSGHYRVEKNILPLPGNRTPADQLTARHYTD